MPIINKGTAFSNGEQLTADKINDLLDLATFNQLAADSASTTVNSASQIIVRDSGVTTAKLATDAVETAKIKDANVTKAKIEDVADYKVLGNVSGAAAAPAEVAILDEDDMASDSDTALATQQSIKAYVDSISYNPNLVQAVKSDVSVFTNGTAMTFVDIPGLQVSITPKSANSKILVESSISAGVPAPGAILFKLVRDGTDIGLGDVDNSATRTSFGSHSATSSSAGPITTAGSFLDSPTSVVGTPIVYKVQCTANNQTVSINRGTASNSTSGFARAISTLTVTEIPQ